MTLELCAPTERYRGRGPHIVGEIPLPPLISGVLPSGGRRPAGTCDVEAGNDQSPLHVGAYPIGCGGRGILQESRVEKDSGMFTKCFNCSCSNEFEDVLKGIPFGNLT